VSLRFSDQDETAATSAVSSEREPVRASSAGILQKQMSSFANPKRIAAMLHSCLAVVAFAAAE
jgi:hypothetical protein